MGLLQVPAEDGGDHAQLAPGAPFPLFLPGDAAGFLSSMLEREKHVEEGSGNIYRIRRTNAGYAAKVSEARSSVGARLHAG
jgi:hypothetical protein